jgi:FlaG/FlaF family flagellin (archaellin)
MKAISPVIATVIIVAVAIAISIAVALWITGMTSSFTGVEKLEVVNSYAPNTSTVYIVVKNTGTKPATVDQIFVNNKPLSVNNIEYNTSSTAITPESVNYTAFPSSGGVTIQPGQYVAFKLTLSGYSSGQTLSIVIHTASGGQYPATVTLP